MSAINNVRLDRPIEFIGYIVNDCYGEPVSDCQYIMSVKNGQMFIDSLKANNSLALITDTLQSLSERLDGTVLETALPSMKEFKSVVTTLDGFPQDLIDLLAVWEEKGVNEVDISFERRYE